MADSQMRALARRVAKLERQRLASKQPTLGFSSIDDGAITAVDEDQNLTMVIGKQHDGTTAPTVVNGPIPPTPSDAIVQTALEGAKIAWDGTFVDDAIVPMDFARVEAHASQDPNFTAEFAETLLTTFDSPRGFQFFAPLAPGTWYVRLVTRTLGGLRSEPSVAVSVNPQPVDDLIDPTPTDPPVASPTVTATGTADAIILETTNVAAGEEIQYHISTTEGFTHGAGTLYVTTKSNVVVATALPDDSPLALDQVYYVKVVAQNIIGEAPPSAETSVTLNPSVVSSLITSKLVAGWILTGRINIGLAYFDANEGIYLPQPGGAIRLPVDGTAATFSGVLTAIQSLTVSGASTFNDLVLLQATFRLGSGVADPLVGPTVSHDWLFLESPTEEFNDVWYGLCTNPAGDQFAMVSSFFGTDVRFVDKATGAFVSQQNIATSTGYAGIGGITRIGSEYFVLGKKPDGKWWIFKYNTSWVLQASMLLTGIGSKRPALGTDGTLPVVVWSDATNVFYWILNTALTGGSSSFFAHGGSAFDAAGVYAGIGGADNGVNHWWIQSTTGPTLCYRSSDKVRQPQYEFGRAGNNSPRGLWWDGTRFWNLDSEDNLWGYGLFSVDTSVDAAWTAYDGNVTGGTHETGASPRSAYTWPKRTRLVITTPPAPEAHLTGTGQDVADLVKVYTSSPAASALHVQNSGNPLALNERTLRLESLNSVSAAPPTNQFTGIGGLGKIESVGLIGGTPGVKLNGDASGRVGPLEWTALGAIVSNSYFTDPIPWTNLTITSPWTAVGSQQPQYKRTADGTVHIRGAVTRNTGTSGSTVATLPAGCRPSGDTHRGLVRGGSVGAPVHAEITTAGVLSIIFTGTPATAGLDIVFSSLG